MTTVMALGVMVIAGASIVDFYRTVHRERRIKDLEIEVATRDKTISCLKELMLQEEHGDAAQ